MNIRERFIWMLGVLVLMPYIFGQPVWDDHILLTQGLWNNTQLLDVWTNSVQGGAVATQYYRPISMTVMAIIQYPMLLHLFALFTHIGSAFLLRAIVIELGGSSRWSMMAGLVFALHPVHVEPLGWMSCIPDILAVHFGLWALLCAIQAQISWMMVALLLGTLSKEIAVLPLVGWLATNPKNRTVWGGFLVVCLGVLLLRNSLGIHTQWVPTEQMIEVSFRTIGLGIWGWWFPIEHYPVRDLWSLPMWNVLMGWSFLLIAGWLFRKQWNWLLVSLGAMVLSLPPVWSGYLAAERYLYMASIGWVIALVFWVSNQVELKSLKMPLIFVFCVAPIHFVRATVWSADKTLFDHATHVLPNSGYSWHLRGMVALRAGEIEESIRFFQQAVQCERPHYLDRELVLQGLIHTEQFTQALNWAEEGPKEGLSKSYLELWLIAARQEGVHTRVQELEQILAP